MKDLHLIQFEANSFMGIDRESPVVIDLTQTTKKRVVNLKGDQGVGKSSTFYALMTLMGVAFNFDVKNFINQKDKTIDTRLKFEFEGAEYEAIQSGTRLTLKRFYKETQRWLPEGSPKETLRRIFGNVGVSPMFLKDLPGKKQIEWFRDTFGSDEEASKKELKAINDLKVAIEQRKDVNRSVKSLNGWLNENELYLNYEVSQKKFAEPINAHKEKKRLEEVTEKYQTVSNAHTTLTHLKRDVKSYENEIANLEQRLNVMKVNLHKANDAIKTQEQIIASSNGIEKEYQETQRSWLNISKAIADQTVWKEVLAKEKERNELQEASQMADATIDKLRAKIREITSAYLPNIKGLEIRVKTSLDDEDEGIFYENKSLAQLSESELWDLYVEICEDKEVQFIFCENVNALGSEAVNTMNRLAKDKKARIFASQVDRSKKEMEISFTTKVE